MRKRILMLALALLLCGAGLAETCTGVIAARTTETITLDADARLASVAVKRGDIVAEGDALAELATEKVFASEDGMVARVQAHSGDTVSGTVLEILPVSLYTIHCTVDSAYRASRTKLVHAGKQVYIKCTADGSHRGTGIVTRIDGGEYQVMTTGGELLVGEAVYLYRDADFTSSERVGIGTVLVADTVRYEAEGTLQSLRVSEGEFVQRGELLYAVSANEEITVTAPVAGIVTQCAEPGAALRAGEAAFVLAPLSALCVEAQVSEQDAAAASVGDAVRLIPADDPEETPPVRHHRPDRRKRRRGRQLYPAHPLRRSARPSGADGGGAVLTGPNPFSRVRRRRGVFPCQAG